MFSRFTILDFQFYVFRLKPRIHLLNAIAVLCSYSINVLCIIMHKRKEVVLILVAETSSQGPSYRKEQTLVVEWRRSLQMLLIGS